MKTTNYAKILAIIALLFITTCAFSAEINYSLTTHSINIQIGTENKDLNEPAKDTVIERYYIYFASNADKVAFREKSIELGTSIEEWKKFNPKFVSSLGDNTINKKIAYNEGEDSFLQISYTLPDQLMAKGKEASMMTEYTLKVNYFNAFYQSGMWIIPEGTRIVIELPPGAELRETVEPQAEILTNATRKNVVWNGYKSTNKLFLAFVMWKQITPVVDFGYITNFLTKTEAGWAIIIGINAILAVLVWKRKIISSGIEGFVEKHSMIKEE